MSFILDALKKSESDRQRHSGPALFEVKVAPPRGAWPLWAVAVAALLVVNLAIVVWMLWRSEEHTSELQSQSNLVCRLLLEKKTGIVHSRTANTRSRRDTRPRTPQGRLPAPRS